MNATASSCLSVAHYNAIASMIFIFLRLKIEAIALISNFNKYNIDRLTRLWGLASVAKIVKGVSWLLILPYKTYTVDT